MADDKRTLLVDPEQPPSYVAYSPMTDPCAKRRCSKKAKCAHAVVLVVLFAAVFAGGFFSGRSHHHDDCSSSSSTTSPSTSSSTSPTPVLVSSGSTALLQTPLQGSVPASSFLWCRIVNNVCVPTNPMLTPQGSLQYFLYEFGGETSLIVTATGSAFGTNGSAPVAEGSINITITTSMARITPFLDDVSSWSTASLVSGSTSRTLTLSSRSSVGFIVTWPGRAGGLIAPTSIEVEGVELSAAVLGGDMPAVVNMTTVLSLSSYTGASVLTTSQNSAAFAPAQHIVYSWNSGSYTTSVNGYYRRSADPSPSARGLAMNMTVRTQRGDVSVLLTFDSRYGGNVSVSVNAQVAHPLSRTRVFVSSPSHPAVTASQTDEAQSNAVDFMRFNSSGVVTSFVWQRVRPSSAAERSNMTWLATTLTSFANTLAANPPAGTRPEQVCTQAAASIFQLWSKCHVANHASLTGTGCTVPLANLCSVMASCGHALQTCDKSSF